MGWSVSASLRSTTDVSLDDDEETESSSENVVTSGAHAGVAENPISVTAKRTKKSNFLMPSP